MTQFKQSFLIVATASALALGACTTTGNVERNTAVGAGLGALAGAVIGNNTGSGDAGTGALIGGVVGAAGGAYTGRQADQNMGMPTEIKRGANGQPLEYDSFAGRYYFRDPGTNRTFWQDGSLRTN